VADRDERRAQVTVGLGVNIELNAAVAAGVCMEQQGGLIAAEMLKTFNRGMGRRPGKRDRRR
jgi:hypothetical protein